MQGTGHGNGGKGILRHSVALIPLPSSETGEPSRETEAGETVRLRDGHTVRMGDKDGMNTWPNGRCSEREPIRSEDSRR